MKTIEDAHFNLLSLLATAIDCKWSTEKIQAISHCCTIAGIEDGLIYAVEVCHIFTSLQRMNILSSVVLFD